MKKQLFQHNLCFANAHVQLSVWLPDDPGHDEILHTIDLRQVGETVTILLPERLEKK